MDHIEYSCNNFLNYYVEQTGRMIRSTFHEHQLVTNKTPYYPSTKRNMVILSVGMAQK